MCVLSNEAWFFLRRFGVMSVSVSGWEWEWESVVVWVWVLESESGWERDCVLDCESQSHGSGWRYQWQGCVGDGLWPWDVRCEGWEHEGGEVRYEWWDVRGARWEVDGWSWGEMCERFEVTGGMLMLGKLWYHARCGQEQTSYGLNSHTYIRRFVYIVVIKWLVAWS